MVSTKKGAREMNSKQIADELENIYWIQGDGKGKPFQQYADFVRQQQAEIEALKDKCLKLLDLMMIREGQPNKPSGDWWKGDATCGGLTENYGLRKAQEK